MTDSYQKARSITFDLLSRNVVTQCELCGGALPRNYVETTVSTRSLRNQQNYPPIRDAEIVVISCEGCAADLLQAKSELLEEFRGGMDKLQPLTRPNSKQLNHSD